MYKNEEYMEKTDFFCGYKDIGYKKNIACVGNNIGKIRLHLELRRLPPRCRICLNI